MNLLNYLEKAIEKEGVISRQELAEFDMKGFKVCEASSLTEEQRKLPNGAYVIQKKAGKDKYFIKKGDQWYSLTTTLEYPNGVFGKQFEEVA